MQTQLRTILVATDGSADAQEAARAAVDLHRQTGAALHVVHAWQIPPMAYSSQPAVLATDTYHIFEEGGKALLDGGAEHIVAFGGTLSGQHLRFGPAVEEISAVAREIAADLVLIGSRGLGPVRRLVMGSVSDGVVHGAPCPVLVMRGGPDAWPPSRVIVGEDGSDDATTASSMAVVIAVAMRAQVTLVRAVPGYREVAQLDTGSRDALIAGVEEDLGVRVRQLVADDAEQVQVITAVEDPAALLLNVAESSPTPALLAIGSRGLRLLDRLRLGSVSTKVLHAAACPVLVASQRTV